MPVDSASLDWAARQLGTKVVELRRRHQWTQEELSARSGLSRNQIQNIEHSRNNTRDPATGLPGRGNPRLDSIFALADAFALDIAILVDPERALPPE